MIPRARPNYRARDLLRAALRARRPGRANEAVAARLADILGLRHVLLTASGRGGLYLILRAGGCRQIVMPAYTCSAVAEATVLAGKVPVHIDHDPACFNHTLDNVAPHLRPGRAYIATHQYGIAAPIEAIAEACAAAGVELYEDIAAALGTRIGNRPAGSFGRACFGSFDTTKLINAPLKGGFIATADSELFARIAAIADAELKPMTPTRKASLLAQALVLVALRDPNLYRMFHSLYFGLAGRMTAEDGRLASRLNAFYTTGFADWQAAVVLPQLERIDALVARRRRAYGLMRRALDGLASLTLPPADADGTWAPIRFSVLAKRDKRALYRAGVARGVDFGFSFSHIVAPPSYANAHDMAARVLNLPFDNLLSDEEIAAIQAVLVQTADV